MKLVAACLFAVVVAACGGKSAPAPASPGGEGGEGGGHAHHHMGSGHEAEHPPMTPELTAFHDVLSPLWHAEPGEQRTNDTCESTGRMRELVPAITAAPPAGADVAAWGAAVDELEGRISDLEGPCSGGTVELGAMTFDDAFRALHEQFHALLGLLPPA